MVMLAQLSPAHAHQRGLLEDAADPNAAVTAGSGISTLATQAAPIATPGNKFMAPGEFYRQRQKATKKVMRKRKKSGGGSGGATAGDGGGWVAGGGVTPSVVGGLDSPNASR